MHFHLRETPIISSHGCTHDDCIHDAVRICHTHMRTNKWPFHTPHSRIQLAKYYVGSPMVRQWCWSGSKCPNCEGVSIADLNHWKGDEWRYIRNAYKTRRLIRPRNWGNLFSGCQGMTHEGPSSKIVRMFISYLRNFVRSVCAPNNLARSRTYLLLHSELSVTWATSLISSGRQHSWPPHVISRSIQLQYKPSSHVGEYGYTTHLMHLVFFKQAQECS